MDERRAVIQATLAKFREIVSQYGKNDVEIKRLQAEQTRLSALATKCGEAAQLFEFDLTAELVRETENEPRSLFELPEVQKPTVPMNAVRKTVRDLILEWAEQASPHPVRAADLRQMLLERGIQTHEKTVGMTLYRMSQEGDGTMRRHGKADWYFIPREQRKTVPARETMDCQSEADLQLNGGGR